MGPICFPVHLGHSLGIKTMVLTNAAGGINDSFKVGDLMFLEDHINFMGTNPLIGPTTNPEIPRFPDQTEIYNKNLQNRILEVAKENNFSAEKRNLSWAHWTCF